MKDGHMKSWIVRLMRSMMLVLSTPALSFASDVDQGVGGVFSRHAVSEHDQLEYYAAIEDAQGTEIPPLAGDLLQDGEGQTNELILLADDDSPALVALLPPGSLVPEENVHAEDVIVQGVRSGDVNVLNALQNPADARYVIAYERLDHEARSGLTEGDPLDELHRYVVLRYPNIAIAKEALDILAHVLGADHIAMNSVSEYSWAPNDPYFAIQPSATNAAKYQWGIHAMNLPSAWDTTQGHGYVGIVDGGLSMDASSSTTYDILPNVDLRSNLRVQFYTRTYYVTTSARFHGSHVAGIVAATANNNQGMAGACPRCSLVFTETNLTQANEAASITSTVTAGAQVINMSWGSTTAPACPATGTAYQVVCTALAFATNRDVVLVGAAGNYTATSPQWPAKESNVLSVGGAQPTSPGNPYAWQMWYFGPASPSPDGEGPSKILGSNHAGSTGVVAPARGIVSTSQQAGFIYSYIDYRCGDLAPNDESGLNNDTYASCTGTSMAAPFVSGLAGLLRSINPRMSATQIRTHIRNSGNWASLPNSTYGSGMPNASTAASQVVSATPNRLAPLFSMYSIGREDYFYTTVPQMASTAACGYLRPRVGGTAAQNFYSSVGTSITGYTAFPNAAAPACAGPAAKAQVWIFTTPKIGTTNLVPLYRMSWKCGDASPSPPAVCTTNPRHTDTTYTTDTTGIATYEGVGYRLDGIEGYIYPKTISQPSGTVRMMRKYNPARDDHAIFPEPLLSSMTADGYTQDSGSDWIGYVYVNTGSVPSI